MRARVTNPSRHPEVFGGESGRASKEDLWPTLGESCFEARHAKSADANFVQSMLISGKPEISGALLSMTIMIGEPW
jgi:hypothetical protein